MSLNMKFFFFEGVPNGAIALYLVTSLFVIENCIHTLQYFLHLLDLPDKGDLLADGRAEPGGEEGHHAALLGRGLPDALPLGGEHLPPLLPQLGLQHCPHLQQLLPLLSAVFIFVQLLLNFDCGEKSF